MSVDVALRVADLHPSNDDIAGDVLRGLSASPKRLSSKYFYDKRGAELFEAITRQPEYYLTRVELALLAECGLHEVFTRAYGAPAKSFPARWPLLPLDRVYLRNASGHEARALTRRPWSHLSDHAPLSVEVHL